LLSAKCATCGTVVKVPPAYGGKRIKCIRCEGIIVIPKPVDVPGELLSDDMLPEVARDEDILRSAPLEMPVPKTDPPARPEPEPEPPPPPRSETRRRTGPGRGLGAERGSTRMTRGPGGERGGTRMTRGPQTKARKKSNLPVILGCVIGGVILIALVVILAVTTGKPKPNGGDTPKKDPGLSAPAVTDDSDLREHSKKFLVAYRNGDIIGMMAFYQDQSGETRRKLGQFLEKGALDGNSFVKSAGSDGQVVFGTAQGGELTMRWAKDGDTWYAQTVP
jgi:hypothetical protein